MGRRSAYQARVRRVAYEGWEQCFSKCCHGHRMESPWEARQTCRFPDQPRTQHLKGKALEHAFEMNSQGSTCTQYDLRLTGLCPREPREPREGAVTASRPSHSGGLQDEKPEKAPWASGRATEAGESQATTTGMWGRPGRNSATRPSWTPAAGASCP